MKKYEDAGPDEQLFRTGILVVTGLFAIWLAVERITDFLFWLFG